MNASRLTFRAWDKVCKCWAFEGFNVIGEVTALGGMESYIYDRNKRTGDKRSTIECWNDFILMQSTGLCDKNGKQIFEGDVVLFLSGDAGNTIPKPAVVGWSEMGLHGWQLYINDGVFEGKQLKTQVLRLWLGKNGDSLEIIGNLYQNPELLEKGSDK